MEIVWQMHHQHYTAPQQFFSHFIVTLFSHLLLNKYYNNLHHKFDNVLIKQLYGWLHKMRILNFYLNFKRATADFSLLFIMSLTVYEFLYTYTITTILSCKINANNDYYLQFHCPNRNK